MNKKHAVGCFFVYVCECLHGYSLLHEWSYIFTHNHLIVFGDKSSFPQWGLPLWKALECCLQVPWVFQEKNAISYYLTLHHQTHVSISCERMVTKPAFHVSHESASQGDLCFFIPVKYLSLLQSWYLAMWSGGHSGGGREECSCGADYKKTNPKPPGSEAELWHFTQWPFPLAGALANYLTFIQSLCVCHPDIHRLDGVTWLQN